jgi:hypothetical protein
VRLSNRAASCRKHRRLALDRSNDYDRNLKQPLTWQTWLKFKQRHISICFHTEQNACSTIDMFANGIQQDPDSTPCYILEQVSQQGLSHNTRNGFLTFIVTIIQFRHWKTRPGTKTCRFEHGNGMSECKRHVSH